MSTPGRARPTSSQPAADYAAVPNADDPYANLSGQSLPSTATLSPDPNDGGMLGRPDSAYMPAPSVISRDSTHESLLPPGTPDLPGDRSSWGSGAGLAAAAGGIAGAEAAGRRPSVPRGQSNLAHSTLGWNNTSNERMSISEEDEEQGHITPAPAPLGAGGLNEKSPRWAEGGKSKRGKKWLWILLGLAALLVIGLGVGLGVGLTMKKKNSTASSDAASDGQGSHPSGTQSTDGTASRATASAVPTSGAQGSLVTFDDGSTTTYDNTFGGTWVWDEANPFNNDARPNSWTPPLSQSWDWGKDKIYGVNLGGWLNTEPFIVPALYEKYASVNGQTAVDEYTLSQNMGDNLTAAMTEHYETFITERDFVEIAAAGLNWIRLPVAFWAIETWEGEPYLERVSWTYLLKAIKWARKYGLRINLDFHALPGSQNGWNHSGKLGTINWMNGVMGLANAQRGLDYIRTLTQFISQPEYAPVFPMFGFINEPYAGGVGKKAVGSFYLEAYRQIREITGIGEGNGPMLSIHDGFIGTQQWYGFLPGADRIALEQHSYMVFVDQPQGTFESISRMPCSWWASSTNTTSKTFGANNAGEWSAASNDCGKWLNNVGVGSRYDGTKNDYNGPTPGSCDYWNDHAQWNQTTKDDLLHFVLASMDALQNYFFWTWKIGDSIVETQPEVNPFWHYRLGLLNGWIPKDPRDAIGTCAEDGVTGNEFDGTFSAAYMTGGPGAGTIDADQSSSYPWPAASFTNVGADEMTSLPQYTATGVPITMPVPTYTSPGSTETISAGSGWYNANAGGGKAYAAISGCSYPPEYSAATLPIPANACGVGAVPTSPPVPTR